MDENPFPDMLISDFSVLDATNERKSCQKCGKSRKYYCYTCYQPIDDNIASNIPNVKLPIKVDILKHPSECDGKSTSPHAAILAPDDVKIYEYPCIPDYNQDTTILIFPGEDAVELEILLKNYCLQASDLSYIDSSNHATLKLEINDEVKSSCEPVMKRVKVGDKRVKETEISPTHDDIKKELSCSDKKKEKLCHVWFNKVVFIDSTWNQTTTIANDERLKGLQRVELKQRKTKFWRNHEGNPAEYLSTIEAIYYFLYDYHKLCVATLYEGQYDNLLYFFCYTYDKIRRSSKGGKNLKAYHKNKAKEEQSLGAV